MLRGIFLLAFVNVGCLGQGYLTVSIPGHGLQYRMDPGKPYQDLPRGGGYVQLLYAPAGAAASSWELWGYGQGLQQWLQANPTWSKAPIAPIAISLDGRLLPTTIEIATTSAVDVRLIGWAGTWASFDEARLTWGGSPIGYTEILQNVLPGTTLPVGFPALRLDPVLAPEPSVAMLTVLGGLSGFVLRHKGRKPASQ